MCWRHTAAKFLSLGVDIDEVDPTGECASIKIPTSSKLHTDIDEVDPTGECASIKIRTSSKLRTSSKIRTITPSTC